MRKKRIMIIGEKNSGKTSLANLLNGEKKAIKKTQDVIYAKNTIDIPCSYIENSWMYKYLISLSQDASHILIVVREKSDNDMYSHGFAKAFTKPVIGIINKEDFLDETKSINVLKLTGVKEPYFRINIKTGEGIEELKKYLNLN